MPLLKKIHFSISLPLFPFPFFHFPLSLFPFPNRTVRFQPTSVPNRNPIGSPPFSIDSSPKPLCTVLCTVKHHLCVTQTTVLVIPAPNHCETPSQHRVFQPQSFSWNPNSNPKHAWNTISVSLHHCLSTSSRLSQVPAPKGNINQILLQLTSIYVFLFWFLFWNCFSAAIAHSPSRRETVFRLRRRKIVITR